MRLGACGEAVKAEIEKAGVAYRVDNQHKHIHFYIGPDELLFVCAATTSDTRRGPLNAVSDARRIMRDNGLLAKDELVICDVNPTVLIKDGVVMCSTLDVARHFGKAHKDVLRVVDRVAVEAGAEFNQRNFTPIKYTDEKGCGYRAYEMTRDGFSFVCMGFTGRKAAQWKVKYIEAFNEMGRAISGQVVDLSAIQSDHNALLEMVASLEQPVSDDDVFVHPRAAARKSFRKQARRVCR